MFQHGSDLSIKAHEYKNATPLHIAAKYGHLEIVKFLIMSGADRTALDSLNRTAIKVVSQLGYDQVVKFLLEQEKDSQKREDEGIEILNKDIAPILKPGLVSDDFDQVKYAASVIGKTNILRVLVPHIPTRASDVVELLKPLLNRGQDHQIIESAIKVLAVVVETIPDKVDMEKTNEIIESIGLLLNNDNNPTTVRESASDLLVVIVTHKSRELDATQVFKILELVKPLLSDTTDSKVKKLSEEVVWVIIDRIPEKVDEEQFNQIKQISEAIAINDEGSDEDSEVVVSQNTLRAKLKEFEQNKQPIVLVKPTSVEKKPTYAEVTEFGRKVEQSIKATLDVNKINAALPTIDLPREELYIKSFVGKF